MGEAITIDGSRGEGGGQVLRTSLSLAALTGRRLEIANIRAGRKKPGLLRQHLACVRAIADITAAHVTGAELGSRALTLEPGPINPGNYRFAVGSAGSASLVFQTVLWPLLRADAPSRVRFEGGTHNPMAPPLDFLARVFARQLAAMGAEVALRHERYGFVPAGGGAFTAEITPCPLLAPLDLVDGGALAGRRAVALVARLPRHIAERELAVVADRLGIVDREVVEVSTSPGPGNVLMIEVGRERVGELVTAFGRRGVRAEAVADHACAQVEAYLAHGAPVGEHLADQLVIPLALAGAGRFRTGALSLHARTNIDVVAEVLGVAFTVDVDGAQSEVSVAS